MRWFDSCDSMPNDLEKLYFCERNSIGGKVLIYKDWCWFEEVFSKMGQFSVHACDVLCNKCG